MKSNAAVRGDGMGGRGAVRVIASLVIALAVASVGPATAHAKSAKPVISVDLRGTSMLSTDMCEEGCDDENPLDPVGDARFQVAARRARSARISIWSGRAWSRPIALRRKGRPVKLPCSGGRVRSFPIRNACRFTHFYVQAEDPETLTAVRDWKRRTQTFAPPMRVRACGAGGCTVRQIKGI